MILSGEVTADGRVIPANTVLGKRLIRRLSDAGIASVDVYLTHDVDAVYEKLVLKKTDKLMKSEEKLQYGRIKWTFMDIINEIVIDGKVNFDSLNKLASDIILYAGPSNGTDVMNVISAPSSSFKYFVWHSLNTCFLNCLIGSWLKLSEHEIRELIYVAALHDLGNLKIPNEILSKPSSLTDEEKQLMRTHTNLAIDYVSGVEGISEAVVSGITQHHETMNGEGYPNKIRGSAIHLYARIMRIADVYDAMLAKKAYREKNTPFKIIETFLLDRYSELDVSIVNTFLDHVAHLYLGEFVRLSDGTVGKLIFIDPNNFAKPFIERDGEILDFSKLADLKIVEISS